MDAGELTEWEAIYTQIEPMPEDRADVRAGVIASQTVAPHLKCGHQPPRPLDYFGWNSERRSKGPSTATLREKFKIAKAIFDRHKKKK